MEHGVSSFGRPWRRARKPRKRRLERTRIFVVGLAGTGAVAAAVPDRAGGMKPGVARGGFRHVDPNYPFRFKRPNGELTPVRKLARKRSAQRLRLLSHEPQPGELRNWAGLDIVQGAIYPKPYALRGVGKKI